jgi:hypothetical protein
MVSRRRLDEILFLYTDAADCGAFRAMTEQVRVLPEICAEPVEISVLPRSEFPLRYLLLSILLMPPTPGSLALQDYHLISSKSFRLACY